VEIYENFLTNNRCYIIGTPLTPKGIMVHSTACPRCYAPKFS
jgi:hypothetical protein